MKPRPSLVNVTAIDDAPLRPFADGRGGQIHLFDTENGAANVDVHVNVLRPGSGLGRYHRHERSENVYVVLEGLVELHVEGAEYCLRTGDAVLIPPGLAHRAGAHPDASVETRILEIYAPPGPDFHVVDSEEVERA